MADQQNRNLIFNHVNTSPIGCEVHGGRLNFYHDDVIKWIHFRVIGPL